MRKRYLHSGLWGSRHLGTNKHTSFENSQPRSVYQKVPVGLGMCGISIPGLLHCSSIYRLAFLHRIKYLYNEIFFVRSPTVSVAALRWDGSVVTGPSSIVSAIWTQRRSFRIVVYKRALHIIVPVHLDKLSILFL